MQTDIKHDERWQYPTRALALKMGTKFTITRQDTTTTSTTISGSTPRAKRISRGWRSISNKINNGPLQCTTHNRDTPRFYLYACKMCKIVAMFVCWFAMSRRTTRRWKIKIQLRMFMQLSQCCGGCGANVPNKAAPRGAENKHLLLPLWIILRLPLVLRQAVCIRGETASEFFSFFAQRIGKNV